MYRTGNDLHIHRFIYFLVTTFYTRTELSDGKKTRRNLLIIIIDSLSINM